MVNGGNGPLVTSRHGFPDWHPAPSSATDQPGSQNILEGARFHSLPGVVIGVAAHPTGSRKSISATTCSASPAGVCSPDDVQVMAAMPGRIVWFQGGSGGLASADPARNRAAPAITSF